MLARLQTAVLVPLALAGIGQSAEHPTGLRVPPGFVVSEYAGPALANDIYTMHIDSRGRIVVAGRGYVRHLIGEETATRAVDLVAGIKDGPMGLLWEGNDLYVVADGGLKRHRVSEGSKPTTILALKTGGEHDAHAVRRGADGALYLLCGNMAGVAKRHVTAANSPVTDPVAGALLRIDADGKSIAVIADGFRNAYDFDFSIRGEPFTFDSDNERCVGLPWFEPTRFYRIVPGGNHGWLSPQFAQTWRKPPYFPDVVAPIATLGRGSPTGVACYRHTHFPTRYQGGFFLADWTFGKIWFVNPDAKPATPEVFLEATGENGFAPTGLAVHPQTGELYVSIGGRGTRGAVYRIRHTKGEANPRQIPFRPTRVKTFAWKGYTELRVPLAIADVRAWQIRLGDLGAPSAIGTVWEGYTLRHPEASAASARVVDALRRTFPSGNADLDRELSRTLAALQDDDPDTVRRVLSKLTTNSEPAEDVHYLVVLARLTGVRSAGATKDTADALIRLDGKYEKHRLARDRNWGLRLTEAATALLARDPALAAAILQHAAFGNSDHVWLTKLPGIDRQAAARRFVAAGGFEHWTAGHVELLATLPDSESRPLIGRLWERGGLEDALVPLLARKPTSGDRDKFVAALRSANARVVSDAADALAALPGRGDDGEMLALVRALRTFAAETATAATRDRIHAVLKARSGQTLRPDPSAWDAWLLREKPRLAKQLHAPAYDSTAWAKRLAGVVWDSANPATGKRLFTTATCAACHDGNQALGPPLAGVTKRFSRDDLFTAILDPNRDVPPRYRATRIVTDDGKTFDGVVIYDAVDGVILQTGANTTVRVAGNRIESRRQLATSPMPSGLLDKLTDGEIADLFAYLKSLGG